MRQIRLGKYKYYLQKKKKIEKRCGNPNCENTFLDTINGKKEFCNQKCLRKTRGRCDRKSKPYTPKTKYNLTKTQPHEN